MTKTKNIIGYVVLIAAIAATGWLAGKVGLDGGAFWLVMIGFAIGLAPIIEAKFRRTTERRNTRSARFVTSSAGAIVTLVIGLVIVGVVLITAQLTVVPAIGLLSLLLMAWLGLVMVSPVNKSPS